MKSRPEYNIIGYGTYQVTLEYGPNYVIKATAIRRIRKRKPITSYAFKI